MSSQQDIDQGYAWVILAAVFFSAVFTFGGTKAFGVFYVEFLDVYGEGSGATAWIASFSMGLMLACGILVTWLTDRFTVRSVMIFGGLLAAVGHFVSAYVVKLEMLYVTYGLLTGFGRGLCFTPSLLMVNTYFVRRRALANGMAFAGSGIGSFVLPFVTRFLLNMYGLKGALLVFSGLTLNLCVCGALMRPAMTRNNHNRNLHSPNHKNQLPTILITDMGKYCGEAHERIASHPDLEHSLPSRPDQLGILCSDDVDTKPPLEDCGAEVDHSSCTGVGPTAQGDAFAIVCGNEIEKNGIAVNVSLPYDTQRLIKSDREDERSKTIDVPLGKPCSPVRGDELDISCQPFSQIKDDGTDIETAHTTVPIEVNALIDCSSCVGAFETKTEANCYGTNGDLNKKANLSVCPLLRNALNHDYTDKPVETGLNHHSELIATNCKTIQNSNPTNRTLPLPSYPRFGLCTLTNPVFIVMELAFLFLTSGYLTHFTMLPAHVVDIGFSKPQADMLLSAIGLADVVGRISVGWFSDLLLISRNKLSAILAILGGISALLIPWSQKYWMLCAYATAVGFLPGSGSVIIFVSMTESLGPRMKPSVFGIHSTLFALPALFSPPIAGWLKDWTGSWNVSFFLVGSCMLLSSAIVLFVAPIVLKRYAKKDQTA